MATNGQLQERIDALLQADTEAAPVAETSVQLPFSPFIPAHAERAGEIASRLFEAADRDGLEKAVEAAEEAARTESSRGLVKRAVKTFVTHHPAAREELTLPTVRTVETKDLAPGEQPPPPVVPEATLPPGEVDHAAIPSRTLPVEERRLDWYREDPFANDHHAHWHDVWNTDGIEEHNGNLITQPRQGELFLYMHQQMLARYDTERKIAELDKAVPFQPPYSGPIQEGYGAPQYATRPSGKKLRRLLLQEGAPPVGPADLDARFDKVDEAITDRRLEVPGIDLGPLTESQLGSAIEPSDLNIDADTDLDLAQAGYQNLHGLGHILTAFIVNAAPDDRFPGVMAFVETAIRDPFFYRWHRHIDDQYARLQDAQGAADLSEHAANVGFRDGGAGDVLLAFSDQVTGPDFDAFAAERLGGEDFGDPDGLATDTLTTSFVLSRVTAPIPQIEETDPTEETYFTTHLVHRPFGLFLRVEADAPQHVTVRVFMAHADLVGDRRMWIELDKFDRKLEAGVNLIGQPDALSSVIKRKGVNAPGAAPPEQPDAWCDCGWPYNLLLPSGASTAEGSPFKLMVVLTNWELDHAGEPHSCGSMSFCGSRQRYPDLREMGYPFHRPFAGGVLDALAALPNVAIRDLTIRCENPRPPE